jgi:uncharacterized damage-inducible protein DinB
MNRQLIDRYANGAEQLQQAVAGLNRSEMLAVPIPGKWSIQQVVIHLADAEASFADRIRRIIAMDGPVLLAWDENKFIQQLHYNQQSAEDAVAYVGIIRRQTSRILRELPNEAFSRTGEHSEKGRQTLENVVSSAVNHMDHHLKFVAEKRLKLGK